VSGFNLIPAATKFHPRKLVWLSRIFVFLFSPGHVYVSRQLMRLTYRTENVSAQLFDLLSHSNIDLMKRTTYVIGLLFCGTKVEQIAHTRLSLSPDMTLSSYTKVNVRLHRSTYQAMYTPIPIPISQGWTPYLAHFSSVISIILPSSYTFKQYIMLEIRLSTNLRDQIERSEDRQSL